MSMITLLALLPSVFSINTANYPPANSVPAGNPQWTQKILSAPKSGGSTVESCPNANDWAFTSDDGPSPQTPVALEGFRANDAKGT